MPRLALRPLVLMAVLALMAVIVGAQAPAPQPEDQETARVVVDLLERGHMARPAINDEIAVKWCDNFIKDLDPGKYYFLKADVEEFKKEAKTLDDQIRDGNIDFARKVFDRYLERQDERYKTSMELLKQKHDFTVDEYISDDPDKIDYPATQAEANERLRKKVKFDLLFTKVVDDVDDAEAVRKWTIRYRDRNRQAHQVDTGELMEIYLSSLTKTFDPHTSYLGPKNLEDMLNQQLHLSLGRDRRVTPLRRRLCRRHRDRPRAWRPTETAGFSPKTRSSASRKRTARSSTWSRKSSMTWSATSGARAEPRSRLVVQPDGTKEKRIYEITREKIELKEQHAKSKVIESKASDGKELKIGVINLPAFYGDTVAILRGDRDAVSATGDCRRILNEFRANGVDAVVFDLRGNGGGLLEEAKTLSGLFIDTGPVVQVKEVFGVKHLDDDDEGTAWDGPLVVLIDKFSASASEIFAGVIRDYGRGLIIGDTSTFGKGTVQQIVMINDHVRRPQPPESSNQPRRPQADDSAVLPGQRREHPDQWRAAAYPYSLDERSPRFRRREDGQRLQVRQGRRLASRQL